MPDHLGRGPAAYYLYFIKSNGAKLLTKMKPEIFFP
jgi:hypothetical protein